LPLGVVSIAISAVMVPLIAASLRTQDGHAFAAAQSRAFEIALALALPAAAGFAVLASPIAAGLFERGAFGPRDTEAVAAALAAICVGLPGHALEKVLGATAFAHEDARTPMLTALAGLVAAIAGCLVLFPLYGPAGVAAAIGISAWVGASLLALVLRRRGWLRFDRDLRQRMPRIVLATVVMTAAIWALNRLAAALHASGSATRLLLLAALVGAGLAVYLAVLQGLGVAKLADLVAAARKRA
jgi:putative peptidoglycan lipid II flippase